MSFNAVLLMLALFTAQAARPTTLIVHAVDPATGRAVVLSSAEMYLDVWGHGETYRLDTHGSEVRIPLGAEWPCQIDTGWCAGLFHFAGRLTLRADGFEDVGSDLFDWLAPERRTATVRFPGDRERAVRSGTTAVVTIPFRRPLPRRLIFVGPSGEAVSGASISVQATLARTNHCGVPEGERLFEAVTDQSGEISLPPGQLEFSVSLQKQHWVVDAEKLIDPQSVDGRFDAPRSTIRIRPLARRPLRLQFVEADGSPARVEVFGGSAHGCGGGAWPLGSTDEKGRIAIEDFYPDEYLGLSVRREDGAVRWQSDPRKGDWRGWKTVTLTGK